MATTSARGYRYPASTDPPNVPLDLQRLAEDVDADVDALYLAQATADVGSAVFVGTYAGQPLRRRRIKGTLTTDGNGDAIILPVASYAGGGITGDVTMHGASTFDLTFAFRVDSNSNLVARVFNTAGSAVASQTVAVCGAIEYWLPA